MSNENRVEGFQSGGQVDAGARYGSEYLDWKDWNPETFGVLSKHEEADISAKLRKSKAVLPPRCRVLEIGFGNGSFLAYGAKRQWEMHGTEVNAGLLERARQRGFRVVHADSFNLFPDNHFDMVAAFDVLEHLPQDDLLNFLRDIQRVLVDGGVFIARFPNGDSPFGSFFQNGDPTHMTAIGSLKVRYLARELGVELVYVGGEPQSLFAGLPYFAHRILAIPTKYLMNLFVNLIMFPRYEVSFFSPNLVSVFRVVKPAIPAR
jgi:SAM-dependent methyltransferase